MKPFKMVRTMPGNTITIPNVAKFLATMGSEEVFVDGTGEIIENPSREQQVSKKSKITVYFDNLRQINQKTILEI